MFKTFIVSLFSFTLSACLFEPAPNIRFQNDTTVNFDELETRFGVTEKFEDLDAGGLTEYRSFPGAFRIGYVLATTGEEVAVIHVKDFVGEEELSSGSYTYVISTRPSDEGFRISGKMSED